jgi:hypothetical protein
MKKYLDVIYCVFIVSMIFLACEKKKESTSTATTSTTSSASTTTGSTGTTTTTGPTYTSTGTGTGNPNYTTTTTGTVSNTNPATNNSSLLVGGSGWSNATCISTNSLVLRAINGNTDVSLNFGTPPSQGTFTYNIDSTPSASACAMVVQNAPNQPAGVVWYGKTGIVTVQTTTVSITATFSGVMCVQQNFIFPAVSVTGTMSCN